MLISLHFPLVVYAIQLDWLRSAVQTASVQLLIIIFALMKGDIPSRIKNKQVEFEVVVKYFDAIIS